MISDDMDLVRQYAHGKSEEAFAALVSKHVNLVYSVALRQVRDPHLAEEVTQTVFVILARKAGSLGAQTVVAGWLYRTTRYVAAKALTLRRRRQDREQEAFMRSELNHPEPDTWRAIEPLLETGMGQLPEGDQNALVLRYFEERSFKEISSALGTTEAGAKMRVNRALGKLRTFFAKRGLMWSAAALAGAISAHSVQAAPAGLAASITAAAIKGTTLTTSTSTLIETTLKLMAWTKLKTTLVAGAIALLADWNRHRRDTACPGACRAHGPCVRGLCHAGSLHPIDDLGGQPWRFQRLSGRLHAGPDPADRGQNGWEIG